MKTSKQHPTELMEMINFIMDNPNPQSNEVPNKVLDLWIEKTNTDLYSHKECFSFFLKLYTFKKASLGITSFEFKKNESLALFHSWVMHIHMEGLRRKGLVELEPFYVFDFETIKTKNNVSLSITKKFKQHFLNQNLPS